MKYSLILAILYLSTTIVTIKHKLNKKQVDRTPGPLPEDSTLAGKKTTAVVPKEVGIKGKDFKFRMA
jgi:hypothetical protein